MSDTRLERLADVLVGYSTAVTEGELVVIEGPVFAGALVRELYRRILAAGAFPLTRLSAEGVQEAFMHDANDGQLEWMNPVRIDDLEHVDVRIAIYASANTRSLTGVDPGRQARVQRTWEALGQDFLQRAAQGEVRWSLTAYPTSAAAQDAEMSLAEYEDFVYRAAFLDHDDPVERWTEFAGRVGRLAEFLATKRELRIVAEGTDLTVGVEDRNWMPSSGHENFPDGEVFTGPQEDRTEGTIRYTYPAIFAGREVDDVRLRFEGGRVVEASAGRGQPFLDEMLALDEGARRLGEFAFGMNDAVEVFTKNILFDEKIGGTVHAALGTAYPETGGKNRSALHWDMICDLRSGSEVYADGELVYRDGAFLNGFDA